MSEWAEDERLRSTPDPEPEREDMTCPHCEYICEKHEAIPDNRPTGDVGCPVCWEGGQGAWEPMKPAPTSEKEPCSYCDGEGFITRHHPRSGEHYNKPCPRCKGSSPAPQASEGELDDLISYWEKHTEGRDSWDPDDGTSRIPILRRVRETLEILRRLRSSPDGSEAVTDPLEEALNKVMFRTYLEHPLPWHLDFDWTREVRDADGQVVAKGLTQEAAEALIEWAEEMKASLREDEPLYTTEENNA